AESDMPTQAERKTYRFIVDYAEQNRGQAPSYATVVSEVEGFDYVPEVTDNYDYLARQIKSHAAKLAVSEWFDKGEFERKFHELDGENFLKWLQKESESIMIRTSVRDNVGTDVKRDNEKFLSEYERRKAGESFRIW